MNRKEAEQQREKMKNVENQRRIVMHSRIPKERADKKEAAASEDESSNDIIDREKNKTETRRSQMKNRKAKKEKYAREGRRRWPSVTLHHSKSVASAPFFLPPFSCSFSMVSPFVFSYVSSP